MLVLTEAAAEVVKSVTSTVQASDGGLRIASAAPKPERPNALRLSAATGPQEDDQVIETAGARVFVDPEAASYLEDKILDARVDEQGNSQFALGRQKPDEA